MRKPLAALACTIAIAIAATLPAPAQAGQACTEKAPTPETIRKGLSIALKTRDTLDASGAQVVLIARVGQDLTRYHLRYSHMAFAWRDHPKGRWFVVHELNGCGTAKSDLYDEGLGNFFLDDLFAYEALIVIPSPDLQTRIVQQLTKDRALALHDPHYNLVAYPFSTKYQHCDQWVLEELAAALTPEGTITTRAMAQAWLKQAGFEPTTLHLSAMERLGGRAFRANVAFDDHPNERRFADKIDTATVEAVVRFLENRDSGLKRQVLAQ